MAAVRTLGPGPGAYLLPSTVGYPRHDPSRARAPYYSMAGRARGAAGGGAGGPGPHYRIDRVTREGTMSAPAWTLAARLSDRTRAFGPGPGAHAPERCPRMREARPPAYSMGARRAYAASRAGPAPNAYMVRARPAQPAYSLGARQHAKSGFASPGPAVYFQRDVDVYRTRQPMFSLGARVTRCETKVSPGPASYPPDLYNPKKSPPAFSFGTRHSPYSPPLITDEDTMDCLEPTAPPAQLSGLTAGSPSTRSTA